MNSGCPYAQPLEVGQFPVGVNVQNLKRTENLIIIINIANYLYRTWPKCQFDHSNLPKTLKILFGSLQKNGCPPCAGRGNHLQRQGLGLIGAQPA